MVSLSNRKGKKARITINMIAVPTILLAGESSTLSGQVQKNGRPAAGIVVLLSTDCTLGTIISAITITYARGKFTATFRSFVPSNQTGFKVASVTAALPSFPGIVTSASIGIIVGARNAAKNKLQMRRTCRSC